MLLHFPASSSSLSLSPYSTAHSRSFAFACYYCVPHHWTFSQQYDQSGNCRGYKIKRQQQQSFISFVWFSVGIVTPSGLWSSAQLKVERCRCHREGVRKKQKQQLLKTLLLSHPSYWQPMASISALKSNERRCSESSLKDVCKVFGDPYRYLAEKCPWRKDMSFLCLQDFLVRQ